MLSRLCPSRGCCGVLHPSCRVHTLSGPSSAQADFPELLTLLHWARQILAVIAGIACGLLSLTGPLGFAGCDCMNLRICVEPALRSVHALIALHCVPL